MEYNSVFRGADWVEIDDPQLPVNLVTMRFNREIAFFNIETKSVVTYPSVAKGTPSVIQAIEKGPDGKLYISGVQTSKGAIFDPEDGIKTSFLLGQGDSMGAFEEKMLIGVYPDGNIHEFDTRKAPSNENPKLLFQLGEEQDRINDIISADGKVFIGSIPDYGKLGGALTVYDPGTEGEAKHRFYRNIIKDQCVISLAYNDGKIYGSTHSRHSSRPFRSSKYDPLHSSHLDKHVEQINTNGK